MHFLNAFSGIWDAHDAAKQKISAVALDAVSEDFSATALLENSLYYR